ncbi:MAG: hypothetical protein BWX77_00712 [Bacteroidetes bacterium ADurb.Bin090]|nr:MAG: hypothetical protein BWX77_00712 [Bacteroidetes bacterium ADurb.Bin090]
MADFSKSSSKASFRASSVSILTMPIEKEPSGIFKIKGSPMFSVISSNEGCLDLRISMEGGTGIFSFSNNSFR